MPNTLDKPIMGIKLKWWAIALALAVAVGLYLRHRAATEASSHPMGPNKIPNIPKPRVIYKTRWRTAKHKKHA